MNADVSNTWLASTPFRVFILVLGIGLFVLYGIMLVTVGINLPDSWVGLVYVTVGLAGGLASFRYYRRQKPILLVPIAIALILIVAILIGTLLFGHKIDEGLRKSAAQSALNLSVKLIQLEQILWSEGGALPQQ